MAVEYTLGNQPIRLMSPTSGRVVEEDDTQTNILDLLRGTASGGGLKFALSDGPQLDAFSRLRVSQAETLFDSQQEYGLDTRTTWDATANGTYAALASNGSVTNGGSLVGPRDTTTRMTPVTAGTVDGDQAVLQSRQYVRYIPGKGQLVFFTGVFADDASDTASFVLRSGSNLAEPEREIQQADWNIDKFDGTGPSGITIDLTTTQIVFISGQWLAVGRVIVGFDIDGVLYPAHQFLNANILTVPYTQTFNLPLRCEAVTDATGTDLCAGYYDNANGVFLKLRSATPGATMQFICCSVQTEGGEEARGFPWGVANGVTGRNISSRTPVISIRPKATYNSNINRAHAELIDYFTLMVGGDAFVEVCVGVGTLTGASWQSLDANSVIEYDVSATAEAGGSCIRSGYSTAGQGNQRGAIAQGSADIRNPFVLSQIDNLAARQFNISIIVTPFSGSVTARGGFNWNEQTI